jgi:hypothetical protein
MMAAGAAVTVLAVVSYDGSLWSLAMLGAIFWLTASFATAPAANISASVSFVVGLAAVVVLGWAGGVIVTATDGAERVRGGLPLHKRLFNASMMALAALAAGGVFHLLSGPPHRLTSADFPGVIVAASLAALVYCFVNLTAVGVIISLTSGLSLHRVWFGSLSPIAIAYLGYGLLGLLMAQLFEAYGAVAAVLFLAPLLVARAAFANYTKLRETYDSTVRALVQAVETKDYYTRGHSERVSRVTEMIARESGMREDRVQVIRIAGMLHDVGKLGVPTKILQKQGKLNQLEFEAIKLHPLRGYEMLCEIDFLQEALTGVYHHHERLDGRGYPMGLQDEEIPEFARIIMVADAFDSMTSTRSYRLAKTVEEAVAELRRCENVQFDTQVVDWLVTAVEKHGWTPHAEPFHGEKVTKDGQVIDSPVPVISTKQGLVVVAPAEQPEDARRGDARRGDARRGDARPEDARPEADHG